MQGDRRGGPAHVHVRGGVDECRTHDVTIRTQRQGHPATCQMAGCSSSAGGLPSSSKRGHPAVLARLASACVPRSLPGAAWDRPQGRWPGRRILLALSCKRGWIYPRLPPDCLLDRRTRPSQGTAGLPVLVLAMGTALAHMPRADADTPGSRIGPPAVLRSRTDQTADGRRPTRTGPRGRTKTVLGRDHDKAVGPGDLARGPLDHRWIRLA